MEIWPSQRRFIPDLVTMFHLIACFHTAWPRASNLIKDFSFQLKNSVVEVQPFQKKNLHHDHVISAMVLDGTVQLPGRLSTCKRFSTVQKDRISVGRFLSLKPSKTYSRRLCDGQQPGSSSLQLKHFFPTHWPSPVLCTFLVCRLLQFLPVGLSIIGSYRLLASVRHGEASKEIFTQIMVLSTTACLSLDT